MAKTLTVYLAADLKKFNSGLRDAQSGLQGFGGTLNNMLGPALIAAGAAAGAFAIKLGIDGVKAAMEDQKSLEALAVTLDNVGLAHATEPVEAYIASLQRAYGVADDVLRPAYDRLIRSTKDVEEANRALQLAMDISAGTGKDLQAVTEALGKAYDGNTSGLSRLGLGIDRAALSSMQLEDIMTRLADTFQNQAQTQARTFEGQLKRLSTASDELKEAFGTGLLNALGDTNDSTDDLITTMENFEPVVQGVGEALGIFAATALDTYSDAVEKAGDKTEQTDAQMRGLIKTGQIAGALFGEIFASLTGPNSPIGVFLRSIGGSASATNELSLSADRLSGDSLPNLNRQLETQNFQIAAANRVYQDAATRAQRLADELDETEKASDRAGSATERLTEKQERLIELYELQGIAFQTTKTELLDQIKTVEQATAAVENYAKSIQQNLLSGINLGSLYESQFDAEGNRTGTSWVEGFNQAIAQAEWFGNVLTEVKRRGADQSLIEQLASLGPETGGALAQEMLEGDGALLQTINDKWIGVQEKTRELALGLVPEFLEAGRLSAIDTLNGLAAQFKEDQDKFKRLGGQLGLQVGAQFKTRMINEIRDAVREVEALATAARAEAVARAEAEQARITEQAVATAISNLIRNSDQRAGRNVQPVLQ
jgi:archaellum component FlaC